MTTWERFLVGGSLSWALLVACGGQVDDAGGSNRSAATATGGGGTSGQPDGSGPTNQRYDSKVACWSPQQAVLPAKSPSMTYPAACGGSDALAGAGGASQGVDDAVLARLVGRWQVCPGDPNAQHWAGLEIGGNKRFRVLDEVEGELVPSKKNVIGHAKVIGGGQLNLEVDGGGAFILAMALGAEDDRLTFDSFDASKAVYARIAPTPENGSDNPSPTKAAAGCDVYGTWDMDIDGYDHPPAITISFDEHGNFVAGPKGTDLCSSHAQTGKYGYDGGSFSIISVIGASSCNVNWGAGYSASFSPSCSELTLKMQGDNCTGGAYLRYGGTLTRKP
jgi:hypothetical protein